MRRGEAEQSGWLRRLLIEPHRHRRVSVPFWGIIAVACVAVAIVTGARPLHALAFVEVRGWLEAWSAGLDVYAIPALRVDYPPNALLILAPLRWLPGDHDVAVYAVLNAIIAVTTAWLLVSVTARLARITLSRAERLPYVLIVLSLAPLRVSIWNGQTSPLVLLLCLLSVRLWNVSATLSGVCLGFAAMKPHVALAFVLPALFARRWRELAASAATVAVLFGAYCLSVNVTPGQVLAEYWMRLIDVYGGADFFQGELDMRPLLIAMSGAYGVGEPLFLSGAIALGLGVLVLTYRARRNLDAEFAVFAAAITVCISVFPFRRHGALLIVPTLLYTLWRGRGRATAPLDQPRWLAALVLALFAIDLPFVAHYTLRAFHPAWVVYAPLAHHVNRLLILMCLVATMLNLWRIPRRRSARYN